MPSIEDLVRAIYAPKPQGPTNALLNTTLSQGGFGAGNEGTIREKTMRERAMMGIPQMLGFDPLQVNLVPPEDVVLGMGEGGAPPPASTPSANAPTFFSRLRNIISESPQQKFDAPQLLNALRGKVSADELATIEPKLAAGGKVTKADVLAHLDTAGLQVKETTLGGKGTGSPLPIVRGLQDFEIDHSALSSQQKRDIALLGKHGFEVTPDRYTGQGVGIMDMNGELSGDIATSLDEFKIASHIPEDIPSHDLTDAQIRLRAEQDHLQEAAARVFGEGGPTAPKFNQPDLVLPGGANYRERLLSLPAGPTVTAPHGRIEALPNGKFRVDAPGLQSALFNTHAEAVAETERLGAIFEKKQSNNFTSTHFPDTPNLAVHVRVNDRATSAGEPVTFLEEVQSDWHQKGRRQGYQGDLKPLTELPEGYSLKTTAAGSAVYGPSLNLRGQELVYGVGDTPKDAVAEALDAINHQRAAEARGAVPSGPFKKDWQELGLKRALRDAADSNASYLSWTTGAQQADRYDLSKQVDEIVYGKTTSGDYNVYAVDKNGRRIEIGDHPAARLADVVGKDVADKILSGQGVEAAGGARTISGVDLKVGGEGMRAFYDKIIPNFLNKFGKKYGVKVQNITIPEIGVQQALPLTPAMKKDILKGLPLSVNDNNSVGGVA